MLFKKVAGSYRVMRITGPAHNLLGLTFATRAPGDVAVESLSRDSPQGGFDVNQLKRAVLDAVREANFDFGTKFQVERIQYVPSDTPDSAIYSLLARSIIERLARREHYEENQ